MRLGTAGLAAIRIGIDALARLDRLNFIGEVAEIGFVTDPELLGVLLSVNLVVPARIPGLVVVNVIILHIINPFLAYISEILS